MKLIYVVIARAAATFGFKF